MGPPPIPHNTAAILSLLPIPTPSYGSGGIFTAACSTRIAASPRQVLDIIRDVADYPAWNSFVRSVTIDAQAPCTPEADLPRLNLGTLFTLHVFMNASAPPTAAGRPTPEELSVLEPINEPADAGGAYPARKGWRIAWRARPTLLTPEWALRCERVAELIEIVGADGADGAVETEYFNWETFYGVLPPVVKLAVGGKVADGLGRSMRELKRRTEGLATGRGEWIGML
ncbi:hypothetical protein B0T25DRAFT_39574 [Lasiosphaeria hispida]|uniref:Coenzyme Q-binding protein COQ10 START domain-containing protein n=1 Tax=Lasiosphaeria hispida TaxID=260671 RepID=A0AAJ0MK58_9PEZI|nr:hypothetical protein B0T25DRAFT_39574 [Lasiosphaeria hispida]